MLLSESLAAGYSFLKRSGRKMYFDCVNSSPSGTEFAAGQSLEYCGETYEVVSAELFAGEDPHHWRVKARKTGGEHI